jgi:signal transduction histidine kinase
MDRDLQTSGRLTAPPLAPAAGAAGACIPNEADPIPAATLRTPPKSSPNCDLCEQRTSNRQFPMPAGLRDGRNRANGHAVSAIDRERQHPGAEPSRGLAREMVKFALAGLVALAVVGGVATVALRRLGTNEALTDAAVLSGAIGHNVVEPALTDAVLDGDAAGLLVLRPALSDWVNGGPIAGVKLWSSEGAPLLTMGSAHWHEDSEALERWTDADLRAQIAADGDVLVQTGEEAVEVYQRLRTPSGREAMLALYVADSSVAAWSQRIWLAFLPALLLGLVVLSLVQMPIAWTLARRAGRSEVVRAGLVRRALESADNERRRIASIIHDRVIHDLTGRGLSLEAAARQAERDGQAALAGTIAKAASATRESIHELRTLLVDIYPPDLHAHGLDAALSDLMAPLVVAGVDARLENNGTAPRSPLADATVYRIAKESLHNALHHSQARAVRVGLTSTAARVVLTVEDDGCGFSPGEALARSDGHFGLRLLTDLVAAAGGVLDIESTCGQGTRVRAEVPNK